MISIGLDEYFNDEAVAVVEWADRFPGIIPEKRVKVRIDILEGDNRAISIDADFLELKI